MLLKVRKYEINFNFLLPVELLSNAFSTKDISGTQVPLLITCSTNTSPREQRCLLSFREYRDHLE